MTAVPQVSQTKTRWSRLGEVLGDLRATFRWPSRLEWRIARRYLRSRRNSRTASLTP